MKKNIIMLKGDYSLGENSVFQLKSIFVEFPRKFQLKSLVNLINKNLLLLTTNMDGLVFGLSNESAAFIKEVEPNVFDIADTIFLEECVLSKGDIVYISPNSYSKIDNEYKSLDMSIFVPEFIESIFLEKRTVDKVSQYVTNEYVFVNKDTNKTFIVFDKGSLFIENKNYIFN